MVAILEVEPLPFEPDPKLSFENYDPDRCKKLLKLKPISLGEMYFGKYKGQDLLTTVRNDKQYYDWLLAQKIKNSDRQRIIKAMEIVKS